MAYAAICLHGVMLLIEVVAHANPAAIGSAEMDPTRDLVVRQLAPNEQLESLSWAAAFFVGAKFGTKVTPESFMLDRQVRSTAMAHY